ncbi:protein zyg-11 homolog [Ptychodera flava]|uniref:protein zyg-11 homolog n=1 Tax=Ptychodera flava TaxID=63121 RepID=UPI00396A3D13
MDVEGAAESPAPPVLATASPETLQEFCLEYISENYHYVCTERDLTDPSKGLQFCVPDTVLNMELSEILLRKLTEKKKITDRVLMLFSNPRTTMLKRAWLRGCDITIQGLAALANHKFSELDVSRLKNVTVQDLLWSFGAKGLEPVKSLNIGWLEVCQRVGKTANNEDSIVKQLSLWTKQLESLDISMAGVETLLYLHNFKKVPLKALTVFHTSVDFSDALLFKDIVKFNNLQHLDISMDSKTHVIIDYSRDTFCKFLELPPEPFLPQLTSLDISGNKPVKESSLKLFYDRRPQIKFLGLALTELCEAEFLTDEEHEDYRPHVKVTGHYTEEQILEGLRRYTNRPSYLHQLLSYLFDKTHFSEQAQLDVIKLVMSVMKNYPSSLGIQMAGSACLYNLTKYELSEGIHVSVLKKLIDIILDAMATFPERGQLQNNCMLVLRNERILYDVNFDYLRAAQLTMQCLTDYDDHSMCRTASIITSILVHKLTTEQKAVLGTTEVIEKLIDMIRDKVDEGTINTILKMTMKILWSLTDELPGICTVFINAGGYDLYLLILNTFYEEAVIQKRALGLFSNVAEVKALRPQLMTEDLMHHVRIAIEESGIEVAYFAGGILALLTSEDSQAWSLPTETKTQLLRALYDRVIEWGDYTGRLVAYRSFRPIIYLLTCQRNPGAQLWAAWTLWHTCAKKPERYCSMLQTEGGLEVLRELLHKPDLDGEVKRVTQNIITINEHHCHSKR